MRAEHTGAMFDDSTTLTTKRARQRAERLLRACLQGHVYRERGSRAGNARAFLLKKRLIRGSYSDNEQAMVTEIGKRLSEAGQVWWDRESCRRAVDLVSARSGWPVGTLHERLDRSIVARFVPEIQRRGGETTIHGKYSSTGLSVAARDHAQGLYLLRAEGWREYGRRHPARMARLAYLCGIDDNGPFAVRVTGTCETIAAALSDLTPAEVRKAQASGRRVLRQGDVWVIELDAKSRDNFSALPDAHMWLADGRLLVHASADGRDHRPLHVPFKAKAVPQSTLRMGRSGGAAAWGGAD